ncbi:MAG: NAD(P)H-hydrate dehydratase, partial [Gemmatimonadaceae bacterium]|nr:NAD(P)H-hydrate dehydratase [Gemmatimonadaceae bacterium]
EGAKYLDARTIETLPDSYTLMRRAGVAAAEWLNARQERSAAVYVGPGNNGGDGWLIAGFLRDMGWNVTVHEAGEPRTTDASRARSDAERGGRFAPPSGSEALILDALLGVGSSGAPRGAIVDALQRMRDLRRGDATVIAIDLPSAVDATTGEDFGALAADHTLSFGNVKRGQLLRRDMIGELHVLDIGLHDAPNEPALVRAAEVSAWVPAVAPDAWKGTRGRLAIVGGAPGMAGAAVIAARGAHASGIGMVRADVAAESALVLQIAAPFATVNTWRTNDSSDVDGAWPHAMVIGPGLDGSNASLRERVLALLYAFAGPVVLDAGALTAFHHVARPDAEDLEDAGDDHLEALRHALRGREALLTPHVGEFRGLLAARKSSSTSNAITVSRFDDPKTLARALNATVLLKGVPTVVAAPTGEVLVSAAGNPALAMGGTGDLLAGIAGALLAQGVSALHAGAAAAWVHGTAAEYACAKHGGCRGVTMELLLHEVTNVWPRLDAHVSRAPHALLDLPAVPTR